MNLSGFFADEPAEPQAPNGPMTLADRVAYLEELLGVTHKPYVAPAITRRRCRVTGLNLPLRFFSTDAHTECLLVSAYGSSKSDDRLRMAHPKTITQQAFDKHEPAKDVHLTAAFARQFLVDMAAKGQGKIVQPTPFLTQRM